MHNYLMCECDFEFILIFSREIKKQNKTILSLNYRKGLRKVQFFRVYCRLHTKNNTTLIFHVIILTFYTQSLLDQNICDKYTWGETRVFKMRLWGGGGFPYNICKWRGITNNRKGEKVARLVITAFCTIAMHKSNKKTDSE